MISWHRKAWVLFVPHFFVLFSSQEPTPSRPTKKAKASPQSQVVIRKQGSTISTRIYICPLLLSCQKKPRYKFGRTGISCTHMTINQSKKWEIQCQDWLPVVLCLGCRHQSRGQGSHSVCHMWLIRNMCLETTSCVIWMRKLLFTPPPKSNFQQRKSRLTRALRQRNVFRCYEDEVLIENCCDTKGGTWVSSVIV